MKLNPELAKRFPDLLGAQKALERAAQDAKRIAEVTGTQWIVRNKPDPTPGHTKNP